MPATQPRFGMPGERIQDTLVSAAPLLAGWSWPYTTITGREDGPQATIVAGIHGCEYVSIRAAMRLATELDSAAVRGRILIDPFGVFDRAAARAMGFECLTLGRGDVAQAAAC